VGRKHQGDADGGGHAQTPVAAGVTVSGREG